ncbi:MAG: amidohydrolase family protein [Chloroflexi bacterium]|nr:amidohydrolase family protein [Chloroflexota bacterium]
MIIDIHGHTNAPPSLYAYKSGLLAGRGAHGKGNPNVTEEAMANAVKNHLANNLDKVGTDVQFLSPRPFQLMHSEKPDKIVHWWVEACNNSIATSVKLAPDRYRGVAGLPQCAGSPITDTFEEIDRCVNDQGFVGIMINPDPFEGTGNPAPGMGDEYWFPLYEKMVRMDIPALIHSASCKDPWDTYSNYFITTETRCIISMVSAGVYDKFPNLKIIVSHGGGAVPYQVGRYRAFFGRHFEAQGGFDAQLKKFYFDTVLYNQEGLDLLFRIVGTDRCMFGTENPGTGSYRDPATGTMLDDLKPVIEGIPTLSDQDRKNVFENVAKKVFPRYEA